MSTIFASEFNDCDHDSVESCILTWTFIMVMVWRMPLRIHGAYLPCRFISTKPDFTQALVVRTIAARLRAKAIVLISHIGRIFKASYSYSISKSACIFEECVSIIRQWSYYMNICIFEERRK